MGLSTAERNRRKRERKKREREEQRKIEEDEAKQDSLASYKSEEDIEVEIEYVPEPINIDEGNEEFEAIRILQQRSVAVITDDERHSEETKNHITQSDDEDDDDDDDDEDVATEEPISNRKLRELVRPSIAQLKQKVKRPDLVEAHDVTAADPEFLVYLKSVPGTVPVPRHWGRKRKYLQGKVCKCCYFGYWLM
jgi:splicing factor 3B subunit 2